MAFRDGARHWASDALGFEVLICTSYKDYTSSEFLLNLIAELLRLTKAQNCAATCIQGEIRECFTFGSAEFENIAKKFDQTGWGVWALASGSTPPRTDDLIDLFSSVERGEFAIFVDLDDGLTAIRPILK